MLATSHHKNISKKWYFISFLLHNIRLEIVLSTLAITSVRAFPKIFSQTVLGYCYLKRFLTSIIWMCSSTSVFLGSILRVNLIVSLYLHYFSSHFVSNLLLILKQLLKWPILSYSLCFTVYKLKQALSITLLPSICNFYQ